MTVPFPWMGHSKYHLGFAHAVVPERWAIGATADQPFLKLLLLLLYVMSHKCCLNPGLLQTQNSAMTLHVHPAASPPTKNKTIYILYSTKSDSGVSGFEAHHPSCLSLKLSFSARATTNSESFMLLSEPRLR